MDISARKEAFIRNFLKLEKEEDIRDLEDLLKKKRVKEYEENLHPMEGETLLREVKEARRAYRDGNVVSSDQLSEKIKRWR